MPSSTSPTASGASLPWMKYRTHSGVRARATSATDPATARLSASPPARRPVTRKAISKAKTPPARATNSHSIGGIPSSTGASSAKGAVNATGSGFHEGPATVSSESPDSSLPQTSQAHGS